MDTFDTFVATRSSIAARRLCIAIADAQAAAPRLFVLHGPPGSGKTHLLHATHHQALMKNPSWRIAAVSMADLAMELVEAVRKGTVPALQRRCATFDLLLVDDIQVIGGKPATQHMMMSLVRSWILQGPRGVIAGDIPPRMAHLWMRNLQMSAQHVQIAGLGAGSDVELRLVVRGLAAARGMRLSEAQISTLVRGVSGDVRSVVGRLNSLEARTMRPHTYY